MKELLLFLFFFFFSFSNAASIQDLPGNALDLIFEFEPAAEIKLARTCKFLHQLLPIGKSAVGSDAADCLMIPELAYVYPEEDLRIFTEMSFSRTSVGPELALIYAIKSLNILSCSPIYAQIKTIIAQRLLKDTKCYDAIVTKNPFQLGDERQPVFEEVLRLLMRRGRVRDGLAFAKKNLASEVIPKQYFDAVIPFLVDNPTALKEYKTIFDWNLLLEMIKRDLTPFLMQHGDPSWLLEKSIDLCGQFIDLQAHHTQLRLIHDLSALDTRLLTELLVIRGFEGVEMNETFSAEAFPLAVYFNRMDVVLAMIKAGRISSITKFKPSPQFYQLLHDNAHEFNVIRLLNKGFVLMTRDFIVSMFGEEGDSLAEYLGIFNEACDADKYDGFWRRIETDILFIDGTLAEVMAYFKGFTLGSFNKQRFLSEFIMNHAGPDRFAIIKAILEEAKNTQKKESFESISLCLLSKGQLLDFINEEAELFSKLCSSAPLYCCLMIEKKVLSSLLREDSVFNMLLYRKRAVFSLIFDHEAEYFAGELSLSPFEHYRLFQLLDVPFKWALTAHAEYQFLQGNYLTAAIQASFMQGDLKVEDEFPYCLEASLSEDAQEYALFMRIEQLYAPAKASKVMRYFETIKEAIEEESSEEESEEESEKESEKESEDGAEKGLKVNENNHVGGAKQFIEGEASEEKENSKEESDSEVDSEEEESDSDEEEQYSEEDDESTNLTNQDFNFQDFEFDSDSN